MRNSLVVNVIITLALACLSLIQIVSSATAEEQTPFNNKWVIEKFTGDVWVEKSGTAKVSLTNGDTLENGYIIRTGRSGRALLRRGQETIMVSPNSSIGLPEQQPEQGKTQILQQSGSIILDVEKKNVKHFEVSTPYLAAIVKGTQFRVSIDETGANVEVMRGKVEVSDFKTGQFVLVKPGQKAFVKLNSANGIKLEGKGPKEKIQQGTPSTPKVKPEKQDSAGNNKSENKNAAKQAPGQEPGQLVKKTSENASPKALDKSKQPNANAKASKVKATSDKSANIKLKADTKINRKKSASNTKSNIRRNTSKFRIGRAIGQVKLDISTSTRGLSRSKNYASNNSGRNDKKNSKNSKNFTYWSNPAAFSPVAAIAANAQNNNPNNSNNGYGINGNNGNNGNIGNGANGNSSLNVSLGNGNDNGNGQLSININVGNGNGNGNGNGQDDDDD